MHTHKILSSLALLAVGGVASYWLYNSLKYGHSPSTAKGVTNSTKGNLTTTTIQGNRVAALAIGNPLDWIGSVTNRAAQLIPSNLSNGSAPINWRIPFGNPESQAAAANAPKATNVSNYRPSVWAGTTFRSGV